jgi:PKD repeat protein
MSDKKFDNKIRELLDSHEPDVRPDWGRMKERIAAAAAVGAIGIDLAGSKIISQLSIAAAVVAGAVTMWVAQQYVFTDDAPQNVSSEPAVVIEEESDSGVSTVYEESEEVLSVDVVTEQDVELSLNDKSNVVEDTDEKALVVEDKPDVAEVKTDVAVVKPDAVLPAENENVNPLELSFSVSTKQACVGVEVDFSLMGLDEKMILLWDFGDGSFSNEPFPSHVYDEKGVFDVTLSVRSPDDGAIVTRTIEDLIEVHPQPEAKLSWTLPRVVTNGSLEVQLTDETEDTNTSTWFVDGDVAEGGSAEFNVPGTYHLNLFASNKFGCQDDASEKIELGNRTDLKAPARFSPDGDGRYDHFMPFGLHALVDTWELVISDASGKEIYATTDYNSPWNGLDLTGELADNGSLFYWTVICVDHSGVQRLYNDVVRVER